MLEVVEAVNSIIGCDVSISKIVLEEWGLDTVNRGSITKEKREEAFAEG